MYLFGLQYQFLSEILRWRAQTTPDHLLFTLVSKVGLFVLLTRNLAVSNVLGFFTPDIISNLSS